ncbi:hypothetical protein [Cyclobacterium salsum]|uniref:hypothetical protein n=1 Tax=Cyclobacterium salsum TaxID=2666329 RepID=UPI0013918414|nr:hypothetical protein [Cyclobacterium salsum]
MSFPRQISLKFYLIVILSNVSSILLQVQAQDLEFNTDGLYNAELFDFIYRGHFENIEMSREELEFVQIFNSYLRSYARQCPDFLPKDKEEIMNTICAREQEQITKNGYGVEISRTSTCIEWTTEGSGLYARSDLYAAYLEVEGIYNRNALKNFVDIVSDQNPIGNNLDRFHKSKALQFDMAQIFELNDCNSPGIRRFEDNLKAFALNKSPVRMEEESKYVAVKKSGGPTGLQDLNKLIDDLVADQSKTWMFNRYKPGSISGVTVQAQDNQGRPTSIKANYNYTGFSGASEGWVEIIFKNGLPAGIYFFDYPNNRKTPNSSIVASYAQGAYQK